MLLIILISWWAIHLIVGPCVIFWVSFVCYWLCSSLEQISYRSVLRGSHYWPGLPFPCGRNRWQCHTCTKVGFSNFVVITVKSATVPAMTENLDTVWPYKIYWHHSIETNAIQSHQNNLIILSSLPLVRNVFVLQISDVGFVRGSSWLTVSSIPALIRGQLFT